MLRGELIYAVGCNSRICPHPTGPIILHELGAGGVLAIVGGVLFVVLCLLIWSRGGWWGGWGRGERMGR